MNDGRASAARARRLLSGPVTVGGRLVLLAALLVAPLALASAGLFAWSYQRDRDAAGQNLRKTADAIALVVDRQLGQGEAFLKALATSQALAKDDFRDFDVRARDAVKAVDGWVALQERSGQQLVNTRLPPGTPLPQLDLSQSWAELDVGRTVVSNLIYGPAAQQWTVGVTVPVMRDGHAVYALSLVMLPSTLSRVLSDQALPEGWVGNILDRAGISVARSRSPERYVGKPPSPSLTALIAASPAGGTGPTLTLEGQPVVTAWSRSPSYGWTFAVGVPSDELAANARQAIYIAVLLGIAALMAGAGAALLVARGITRPHEALERNARALGRGETVAAAATGLRATDRVMAAMHTASVALHERENELRTTAARLRATFESAPAGIAEADIEGRIIRANRRYQEITGRDEALIGMKFLDITHPDDVAGNGARYRQLLAGEMPSFRAEKRYVRPDGSTVWVDLYVTLIREASEAPFSLAVVQDITERKQAEAARRDSEARFRTMLEALPHLAFVLRPDGSTEYHNRRFAEYFGIEPAGLNERIALVHPEDRPRLMAMRAASVAAGTEYGIDVRVRRHDGLYRWHALQVRPLRGDGDIVSWLGTSVDIDDIRRMNETLEARVRERTRELETAQETLRQAQRLEAVGQLTGGVAHDFNNLLTVLSGNLDLLDRQVQGMSAKRLIDAAHRAVARAANLTQSLLAFARRQDLHPQTVNANRLIKEFSDLLRRAAGDRVEVQLLLSPTLDPCRIDGAHFEAALLNLVANARDAMPPPGGRISIETENATVSDQELAAEPGTKPGRFVCVKVSDTGSGMTADTMKRAFEPFFTTKDIGKGSGLGLSQVYGFAKQSGGFVRLTSEPGIGTTVHLYLPHSPDLVVDRAEEHGAGSAPRAQVARTEAILVVEDDIDVRDTVAEGLRTLGYQVLTAEDGGAALALLERGATVDLLFTDVSMPRGMSGDELAHRARRLRPGLKILLTSGYAAAVRDGALLEQFSVLAKPYRSDELARAIRASLDG